MYNLLFLQIIKLYRQKKLLNPNKWHVNSDKNKVMEKNKYIKGG